MRIALSGRKLRVSMGGPRLSCGNVCAPWRKRDFRAFSHAAAAAADETDRCSGQGRACKYSAAAAALLRFAAATAADTPSPAETQPPAAAAARSRGMSRSSRGCAAMPHALPGENGAADSENVGQGLTALEDAAGPRPRVQIFCGCGRAALLRLRLRPAGPRRFGECRSGMYSFGRRSGSMSHARVLSFSGRGRAAMARAATDGLGYLLARSCGRSRHTYNYNHTSPDTPLRAHARMRARTQARKHARTQAPTHANTPACACAHARARI